jgi:hypothetical protein
LPHSNEENNFTREDSASLSEEKILRLQLQTKPQLLIRRHTTDKPLSARHVPTDPRRFRHQNSHLLTMSNDLDESDEVKRNDDPLHLLKQRLDEIQQEDRIALYNMTALQQQKKKRSKTTEQRGLKTRNKKASFMPFS